MPAHLDGAARRHRRLRRRQAIDERIFVSGGFAEVTAERCTVLADQAVPISAIDRGAIEADLKDAREDLADAKNDLERAAAEAAIAVAEAKITAVETTVY